MRKTLILPKPEETTIYRAEWHEDPVGMRKTLVQPKPIGDINRQATIAGPGMSGYESGIRPKPVSVAPKKKVKSAAAKPTTKAPTPAKKTQHTTAASKARKTTPKPVVKPLAVRKIAAMPTAKRRVAEYG